MPLWSSVTCCTTQIKMSSVSWIRIITTVPLPLAPIGSLVFVKLHSREFAEFRSVQKCTQITMQKMPASSCNSWHGKTRAQGHELSSGPWLTQQEKSIKVPSTADGLCYSNPFLKLPLQVQNCQKLLNASASLHGSQMSSHNCWVYNQHFREFHNTSQYNNSVALQ